MSERALIKKLRNMEAVDKYTASEYYYCKNEGGFNVKY